MSASLLLLLLLVQSAGFGVALAWRTLARDHFAARFCSRQAEEIPMCYGSCRLVEMAAGVVGDGGSELRVPDLQELSVFQEVGLWAGPQVQAMSGKTDGGIFSFRERHFSTDFTAVPFRPPIG
jgi:hypothetical protein